VGFLSIECSSVRACTHRAKRLREDARRVRRRKRRFGTDFDGRDANLSRESFVVLRAAVSVFLSSRRLPLQGCHMLGGLALSASRVDSGRQIPRIRDVSPSTTFSHG